MLTAIILSTIWVRLFYESISFKVHADLFDKALKFVKEQCDKWFKENNTVLALRYSHLFSYFLAHHPDNEENAQPDA